jgi:hypothetical protein
MQPFLGLPGICVTGLGKKIFNLVTRYGPNSLSSKKQHFFEPCEQKQRGRMSRTGFGFMSGRRNSAVFCHVSEPVTYNSSFVSSDVMESSTMTNKL